MPRPSLSFLRRPLVLVPLLLALALLAFLALRPLFGRSVEVVTAQRGEIRQSVVASGRVRSPQRSVLTAQVAAQVRQVLVSEGQTVAAGDLLIELDDRELKAAAGQARAQLAQAELRVRQLQLLGEPLARESIRQAEANLTQAQRQFERVKALVAKGFYSPNQLDDARRALSVAESQARASRLQAESNASGGADFRLAEVAVTQARAALAVCGVG